MRKDLKDREPRIPNRADTACVNVDVCIVQFYTTCFSITSLVMFVDYKVMVWKFQFYPNELREWNGRKIYVAVLTVLYELN